MTHRTTWLALSTILAIAPSTNGADSNAGKPLLGSVRGGDALGDAACRFNSKLPSGATEIVVGNNLECEIWANVDGVDVRLQSSAPSVCQKGWSLPDKGQRFSRIYTDGSTKIRADYRVTDLCWVADRCEYIAFDATFRVSRANAEDVVAATRRCSW
jgi:hypothetical protein